MDRDLEEMEESIDYETPQPSPSPPPPPPPPTSEHGEAECLSLVLEDWFENNNNNNNNDDDNNDDGKGCDDDENDYVIYSEEEEEEEDSKKSPPEPASPDLFESSDLFENQETSRDSMRIEHSESPLLWTYEGSQATKKLLEQFRKIN